MSKASVDGPASRVTERHFTLAELGEAWALDEQSIRRIFVDEPEVLVYSRSTDKSKRRYTTMRIPESVAARVHLRMSIA